MCDDDDESAVSRFFFMKQFWWKNGSLKKDINTTRVYYSTRSKCMEVLRLQK